MEFLPFLVYTRLERHNSPWSPLSDSPLQDALYNFNRPVKHPHSMPMKPRCCNLCRMRPSIVLLKLMAAHVSPKFQYAPASTVPLHLCRSPMLSALMHTHTITEAGFCSFHWQKSGWSFLSLARRIQNPFFPKTS